MKIGFIIQARMSSTRLPNKMAMPFGNETSLLGHIIDPLQMNVDYIFGGFTTTSFDIINITKKMAFTKTSVSYYFITKDSSF